MVATDIETEAEYKDRIYEQTVTGKVMNSDAVSVQELRLFDGPPKVTEEMIGENLDLVVSVLPVGNPTVLNNPKKDIKNAESPSSIWSYTFCGELIDCAVEDEWYLKEHDRLLLLDVGAGHVLIQPDNDILAAVEDGSFEPGVFLRVVASRTEIVQVR